MSQSKKPKVIKMTDKIDYSRDVSADGRFPIILEVGAIAAADMGYSEGQIRSEYAHNAKERVDQLHAKFMRDLTGNATIEERDTWPRKLAAAVAIKGKSSDKRHIAALAKGAEERGITVSKFAERILEKDLKFAVLQDEADALRTRAKVGIAQAASEAVPLSNIDSAFRQLFDQIALAGAAKIAEWQTGASS